MASIQWMNLLDYNQMYGRNYWQFQCITITLEQLEEVIKSDFPSRQSKEFRIYCSAKEIDKINKMVFEELKKYGRLQ